MLGKLIKHEWKNSWKIPTIILAALFVMTIITGLTFAAPIFQNSNYEGTGVAIVFVWLLFYAVIIGASLGITLYMAIRFYKSMFTDEGYLTHTLPVSKHELMLSKVIPMSIWQLITSVSIVLSLFIVGGMAIFFLSQNEVTWAELQRVFQDFFSAFQGAKIGSFLFSIILLMLAGCFSGTLTIIGSISLGQMIGKHKILGSIGGYFFITTVIQIVTMILIMPGILMNSNASDVEIFSWLRNTYYGCSVLSVVVAIGLYFMSYFLVSKKLNLD